MRTCVVRADSAEGVHHAALAALEAQGVRLLKIPDVPPLQLLVPVPVAGGGLLSLTHQPTHFVPLVDLAQQLPLAAEGKIVGCVQI